MGNSMEIPQKLKIELPYDPAILLLGTYLKKTNTNSKRYMHPYILCSSYTIVKIWKQPKCPLMDEWIKKMWRIYTMECYPAIKKEEILPFLTTWMDLEAIILSDISQRKANTI